MSFRITPDAVAYIKKYLTEQRSEEMVLAFAPQMDVPAVGIDSDGLPQSLEELARKGRAFIEALPRQVSLQWSVGSVEKRRIPVEDCRTIDGVPVYVPQEMEKLLSNRVLKLDNGTLRFEPELEPYDVTLPS